MNEDIKKVPEPDGARADNAAGDAELQEWQSLIVEWLNNPPERTRPSVVLPRPTYFDRTVTSRERFMARAKPKINKKTLLDIIRGGGGVIRNCLVSANGETIYVPAGDPYRAMLGEGEIDVPIGGIGEPSWRPGRDRPGGGGNGQEPGEDDADIVYMPISYEEFIELLQLLFDLPFLKQTNADKLLTYSLKMRGLKRSGPMARWDKKATAIARIERFRATIAAQPDLYPHLNADSIPTPEEFPFHKVDLRFRRVEERWDPDSKAVVFYELDCSGSMAGEPLAIAKFTFLLFLIWLRSKYNGVVVVFIAHNHRAERIKNEFDFFRVREDGGTLLSSAHELTYNIARAEFGGDDWSKYAIHASDGFGEPASYITPWIEQLIRTGFSWFGYLEINPYGDTGWWWWSGMTSGMEAVRNVAPDVKPHVGSAKVSSMEQAPDALNRMMTPDMRGQ